eukprot:gnl/Chilomastix_cuspidata/772.p5 GENE.gnl/Chilomastix_cuspidata/772~~gnl/Chilomastix_cuspidata/772.p5  ORF type:complete len:268 (-),score=124.21 gnl/Chilomastix_cuspidata/772:81-884(-)
MRPTPVALVLLALLSLSRAALTGVTYHDINPSTTLPFAPPPWGNTTLTSEFPTTKTQSGNVVYMVTGEAYASADVKMCTNQDPTVSGTVCYTLDSSVALAEDEQYQTFVGVHVPADTYYLVLMSGATVLASDGTELVVITEPYLTEFIEPTFSGWSCDIEFEIGHFPAGSSTVPGTMTYFLENSAGVVVEYEEPDDTDQDFSLDIPRELPSDIATFKLYVYDNSVTYEMEVDILTKFDDTVYYATIIAIAASLVLILIVLIVIAVKS